MKKIRKNGVLKSLVFATSGDTLPLSKLTMLFVFDILFALPLVWGGISVVSSVASPSREIPEECAALLTEKGEGEIPEVKYILNAPVYASEYEVFADEDLHESCKPVMAVVTSIRMDEDLTTALRNYGKAEAKFSLSLASLDELESVYQKILVKEKSAGEKLTEEELGLKSQYHALLEKRNVSLVQVNSLSVSIQKFDEYVRLRQILEKQTNQDEIIFEQRKSRLLYPLRKFLAQLVFTGPFVVLFVLGYLFYRKKTSIFGELFHYHGLFVLLITIFSFLGYQVIHSAAQKIARSISVQDGFSYLWFYGFMAAAAGVILILNKIFSGPWRLGLPYFLNPQRCLYCESKIPDGLLFCSECGKKGQKECPYCHKLVYRSSKFCGYCGKPLFTIYQED